LFGPSRANARTGRTCPGGRSSPGGHFVPTPSGGAGIAVCDPARLAARLPGVAPPQRAPPLLSALFLRVADRARAREALERGGFAPHALPDGAFAIGADVAHGVALVFG